MICPECGRSNNEGANFCAGCGAKLTFESEREGFKSAEGSDAVSADSEYQLKSADYTKLGGWLAFVCYAQLVAMIAIIISVVVQIVMFFTLFKYASLFGGGLVFGIIVVAIIDIAVHAAFAVYCYKMYSMIKGKDHRFMLTYEIAVLIRIGFCVLFMIISAFTWYMSAADYLGSLIGSIFWFVVWELYFRKSVRVRTYFGSDKFLRLSLISKIIK